MSQRFPRDRFDEVHDGPRVGAHRGAQRRGRGWIAFAWAALATGVLVLLGVLALALVNGSYSFGGSTSSPAPAASSSAPASSEASPSESPSESASQEPEAAEPAAQGTTKVVVLNGTSTGGLAARGATALRGAGWKVASTGDAGTTGTASTIVYYQEESQAAVARGIAKTLGVTAVQQSDAFPNAGVSVVLGADYRG
ncbi:MULTISPECIES: LytR C-terminal domain-containing protein [unclassified Curtobacterium]|uniref:LytR C-terminal domain-containing protein n=1 Tax=unclassified Curtobacterium TaxID=257496 RepID=UPI0008261E04|nr:MULTISPECIES: LytR C-terminal domain-containing protein [unclassified Curtobacterium]WIA96390.1 LytR C-terminal domain-containing protein [Curtobacterium sp. MCBA15_004]WIA99697.1 LytR C-terminal domain-containing protein [Curtobacterium sp. MCBA15_012]